MLAQIISPVIIIGDVDKTVLLHGIKNRLEVFPSAQHFLKQNSVLYGLALNEGIADGVCAEEPVFNASIANFALRVPSISVLRYR